jgi:hypothetical protein
MKKALALLLIVALKPAIALAQQATAMVTTLDGSATVARATQLSPVALTFKDTLFLGDRIATAERSLVRMFFRGKAVLTMSELSVLTITEEVGNKSTLTLDSGKIAYGVVRQRMQPGEVHEIRTPNAIAHVRGTVVIVAVEGRSAQGEGAPVVPVTNIDTLAGTVFASVIGGSPVQLGPKQGITITGNVLGPVRTLGARVLPGGSSSVKSTSPPADHEWQLWTDRGKGFEPRDMWYELTVCDQFAGYLGSQGWRMACVRRPQEVDTVYLSVQGRLMALGPFAGGSVIYEPYEPKGEWQLWIDRGKGFEPRGDWFSDLQDCDQLATHLTFLLRSRVACVRRPQEVDAVYLSAQGQQMAKGPFAGGFVVLDPTKR